MATNEDKSQLTRRQIVRLGSAISADNIESIAEGYLDIDDETIKNIQRDASSSEAFNRDIIRYWMHKNPENQVQKLKKLLLEAASDCSYVDPRKVEQILGTEREEVALSSVLQSPLQSDITEEDFQRFAEAIKPVTEEALKIDMAPWAKAYTEVDMDKLYTDLTLEKLENTPVSVDRKEIENYQELFKNDELQGQKVKLKAKVMKRKGKRILCKGDPGMGKTTWGKKVGWDWAKGIFTAYSIVFFVLLKLVQPGDAIENVIVQQNPDFQGLGMTADKLKRILENFSERCLLILDGLDEHALGPNGNVLEIIRGQELFYCNVVVTSRPHSTQDIERYFPTVITVQGFTIDRARQFCQHLLNDGTLTETVINFRPSPNEFVYNCPIILLILCILVKEDKLDLRSESLDKGYIYFRLTRFLYQKYASSQGINYSLIDFMNVLAKLGKLAWETLKTGNPFLQRSQVIRDVGEDAFKYGLLIGHEDFRLIGKETADILITFPHRTIQEFLASFYFVLMLDEGMNIESLIDMDDRRTTRFMIDPLFLHFCLWFVFSDQIEIPFQNKTSICNCFLHYVSKLFNLFEFDLEMIGILFPAFDLRHRSDNLVIRFFGRVLQGLQKVKYLILLENHPVDSILAAMGSKLQDLSSITIRDGSMFFRPFNMETISVWPCNHKKNLDQLPIRTMSTEQFVSHMHCAGHLDIILSGEACKFELLHTILEHCKSFDNCPSVLLCARYNIDVSRFFHKNIQKLFILNRFDYSINCTGNIPKCPNLTHLYLVKAEGYTLGVKISLMTRLQEAFQQGNLPKLTHLCLQDCNSRFGTTTVLRQSGWSTLTYLNLSESFIEMVDNEPFWSSSELPNLESLCLFCRSKIYRSTVAKLFQKSWPNLRRLFVDNITEPGDKELLDVLREGKLPNLIEFGLSLSPKRNSLITPKTIFQFLSKLQSLTLRGYSGFFRDIMFTKQLREIEICHNPNITRELSSLLSGYYPSLSTLMLSNCGLKAANLTYLAHFSVEGRLPTLRHLNVSENQECMGHISCLFDFACMWNGLLSLDIQQPCTNDKAHGGTSFSQDSEVVMWKLENGCLSSLEELSFTVYSVKYFGENAPTALLSHLKKLKMQVALNNPFSVENIFTENEAASVSHNVDHPVLQPLQDMVRRNLLPALRNVFVVTTTPTPFANVLAADIYFFSKNNICLHISQK